MTQKEIAKKIRALLAERGYRRNSFYFSPDPPFDSIVAAGFSEPQLGFQTEHETCGAGVVELAKMIRITRGSSWFIEVLGHNMSSAAGCSIDWFTLRSSEWTPE